MIRSSADPSGFFSSENNRFFWEMEVGSVYSSEVLLGLRRAEEEEEEEEEGKDTLS